MAGVAFELRVARPLTRQRLAILELLAKRRLTNLQIARLTGRNRATNWRIMTHLSDLGFVEIERTNANPLEGGRWCITEYGFRRLERGA